MKKRLRTHYVSRAFQWKYVILSLALAVVVAFLVGYTYKKNGLDYLIHKISNVYPVEQTYGIRSVVNKNLSIRLALVFPFIVIFSILLSHRVAGPINRIVQGISQIGEGDIGVKIKLRKGDELLDLAEGINQITDKIGAMVNEQKAGLTQIRGRVTDLKSRLVTLSIKNQDITSSLDNIEEAITGLEKSLLLRKG